jgi:hypothetical protein
MAEEQAAPAAEATMPAVAEVKTKSVTASVVAINYATRMVSLKGQSGNIFDQKVSAEVKNLNQINVGDLVVIEFVETIKVFARKSDGGKPRKKSNETVQVARPGAKPMKVQVTTEEIVTEVTAIDSEKRIITLNTPSGWLQTYFVPRHYKHLDNVKKGDQVVVRFSKSVCIKVTKVDKAAKPAEQTAPVPSVK